MAKKNNTHEIVKYHNSLNTVPFAVLTQRELNVFFAICSKLKVAQDEKDKLTQDVQLTFKELRSLTGCESMTSNNLFEQVVISSNRKLLKATPEFKTDDGKTVQFSLFKTFVTDPHEGTLNVSVNETFTYILSAAAQFTRFELDEYVRIKSVYAKIAYQNLKQRRHLGQWGIEIEDFRETFMVPPSFKASHINDRILKPILKELTPYFKNLSIEKVHGKGSGRPIIKYIFLYETEERYRNKHQERTHGTFTCPECGGVLIEREMNGVLAWCHPDGHKDDAKCKLIFNTVAEIKGYKEK